MEFKKISSLSVCVSYFILVVDLVVILIASLILLFVDVMMKLFIPFMRPCSRNKKLQEEWIVPLKFVKDICEVPVHIHYMASYAHFKNPSGSLF